MVGGNHTVEKEAPMSDLVRIFDEAMRKEGFKIIPVGRNEGDATKGT